MKILAVVAALLFAAHLIGDAEAQTRVGVAGAVNPQSQFDRSSGLKTVVIGDNVLFEDRIITGELGLVQVLFVDGSTFTVGPTARVVIDEFVFNPSDDSGSLVAEVTSGALRFVGGKLSKRGNEVRFRTPGGTLGVRGGITNIDLEPPCLSDGRCPTATAAFIFGDELTLQLNDGNRRRIHEPGYSFVFFGDPRNPSVEIIPTKLLDTSSLLAKLSGRPGASGGSDNIPTDPQVVASGIPVINSQRAPISVLPRPKPIVITSRLSPEPGVPGITRTTNVLDDTVVETSQSDFVRVDVEKNIEDDDDDPVTPPTPIPEEDNENIASYVTPENFITASGVRVDDPGNVGIVAPFDLAEFGGARFVTLDDGTVVLRVGQDTLPFPDEMGETTIAPFNSRTLLGVRGRGTVVRGPGDFAFYYLQPVGEGDPERVLYLVTGDPTGPDVLFKNNPDAQVSIRAYELSDDFQKRNRGIGSELRHLNPLVAREFGIDALSQAAETPFLIATRRGVASNAQTLYGGLLITGQGASQRSAIDVDAGFVSREENSVEVVGRRRGTYRLGATLPAAVMTGSTGTLLSRSDEDRSSLFGPNGQSMVYTSGIEIRPLSEAGEQVYRDRQRSNGFLMADQLFSSTASAGHLAETTPGRSLSRQSRTLTGYAAGMVESSARAARPFRSTDAGDFTVSFDPDRSNLGGVIDITDVTDTDPVVRSYRLAFGSDIFGGKASTTRGTYIDDDTYGAVATGPSDKPGSPQTSVTTDSGRVVRHTGSTPDTYMISSTAVPQPQLFEEAGVEECECAFLEWGWWGTGTDFEDEELSQREDFAHLGTWVAGDVTPAVDLPTTGTGSYAGHAVGSVVSQQASGVRNRYVAVGDLDVDYNFARRTGQVSISNFDGRNFSGTVAGGVARDGVSNQFSGRLSGGDVSGNTRGAFVRGPRGPAQGVMGAFDVQANQNRYRAVGNYVGERVPGRGR